MIDNLAPLPLYVLLEENAPIRVQLVALDAEESQQTLYAFSDKKQYDAFTAATTRDLRPYPLVKGYLRNQLTTIDDGVRFVAIDAPAPNLEQLNVASIESVIDAFEKKSGQVVTHIRNAIQTIPVRTSLR
jgi:hypothetical protein